MKYLGTWDQPIHQFPGGFRNHTHRHRHYSRHETLSAYVDYINSGEPPVVSASCARMFGEWVWQQQAEARRKLVFKFPPPELPEEYGISPPTPKPKRKRGKQKRRTRVPGLRFGLKDKPKRKPKPKHDDLMTSLIGVKVYMPQYISQCPPGYKFVGLHHADDWLHYYHKTPPGTATKLVGDMVEVYIKEDEE